MSVQFGTSGLRGLVSDLSDACVASYVRAFLQACRQGNGLYVGHDLRPSSQRMAETVIKTALSQGVPTIDCGAVPTPALALAAMNDAAAAIMVTGSHIPADRNGLKFYVPQGEISKADEAEILKCLGRPSEPGQGQGAFRSFDDAGPAWVRRYISAFGTTCLKGLKVGVWSHSAVSRDFVTEALRGLGAEVIDLGRSDAFLAVDTEAIPDGARKAIRAWVSEHHLDALVSTDGDGDRPLLADETGTLVAGDLLGQITARLLAATAVVTPLTSNAGVEACGHFKRVIRTKVGSPHVIAAMQTAGERVVGYEANGGFLLGFDAILPRGRLAALRTRDSLLPIVATLVASRFSGGVAALVASEPKFAKASDRLEGIAPDAAQAFLASLQSDRSHLQDFLSALNESARDLDLLDGLRITCTSGRVVHLRPSGNAPELRVYVQTDDAPSCQRLLTQTMKAVSNRFAI